MSIGADDELVRRLFAEATALLEDAHEAAVAGQSERLDTARRRHHARTLEEAARTISALARASSAMLKVKGRPRSP